MDGNKGKNRPGPTKPPDGEKPHFEMSSPWGTDAGASMEFKADDMIRGRTELHVQALKEEEKTKRLALVVTAVMVLGAMLGIVFAPAGREVVSYWIGATLLVFAAGAAGYKRVWGRSRLLDVGGDQNKPSPGTSSSTGPGSSLPRPSSPP
jgi:hypothetical protein